MTRNFATLSALVLALALTGCVQTQATMLSSKTYAPLEPEQVTIYLSEDDIPGRFERVAIINAKGSTSYTNQNQMYEAVRKKAAEVGANGVLFAEVDEPSAGAKIAGAFLGTGSNRNAEMAAIYVFVEDETDDVEEDGESGGDTDGDDR